MKDPFIVIYSYEAGTRTTLLICRNSEFCTWFKFDRDWTWEFL